MLSLAERDIYTQTKQGNEKMSLRIKNFLKRKSGGDVLNGSGRTDGAGAGAGVGGRSYSESDATTSKTASACKSPHAYVYMYVSLFAVYYIHV